MSHLSEENLTYFAHLRRAWRLASYAAVVALFLAVYWAAALCEGLWLVFKVLGEVTRLFCWASLASATLVLHGLCPCLFVNTGSKILVKLKAGINNL